jgi:predicted RNase H-like HicB family nuclease
VAAADTIEEAEALIREAVVGHVELLREKGELVPQPASRATLVEVT